MSLGPVAAILATFVAGLSFVGLGLRRRLMARVSPVAAQPEAEAVLAVPAEAADVADHVAARVEGLLTAQSLAQADALAELKAEILGLKSDVEWLAGERMIEQAIALAQSGIAAEEIGRELGMSRDAAETIVAFRRH